MRKHTLLLMACLVAAARSATTPWMLGEERAPACYTLDTLEDIPIPRGLDMQWIEPPPASLDSTTAVPLEYQVTIDDSVFWTDVDNVARLGTDYSKWQRLCDASATVNNTNCNARDARNTCCVWHSNIHSCRQSAGSSCEPWVSPRNATAATPTTCSDGSTPAPTATPEPQQATVLVTHTAAQVGVASSYNHELQLPDGSWIIISHVKIMNFQCAVGSLRRSVAPPPAASDGIHPGIFAAIATALVVALAGVFVAVSRVMKHSANVRNVANAPTGEKGTTTSILFTDIQDSTQLWGNYTASMALTLDTHHRVIRAAIDRHDGYEVKTVGDAFMIACKSPEAAVAIARDIQLDLQREQWPTCINMHYDGIIADDEPENVTTEREAGLAFNGPRVRIGVHTGTPEATWDDVAKGYDYYGPDVNQAARTESAAVGGQILMSMSTLDAVRAELGQLALVIGGDAMVSLKGIDGEVTLTAVEPTDLATARKLGVNAAAVKAAALKEEDSFSASGTGDGISDSMSVRSGGASLRPGGNEDALARRLAPTIKRDFAHAQALVHERSHTLATLLKPLLPKDQTKVLDAICAGWRTRQGATQKDTLLGLTARLLPAECARGPLSQQQPGTAAATYSPALHSFNALRPSDSSGGYGLKSPSGDEFSPGQPSGDMGAVPAQHDHSPASGRQHDTAPVAITPDLPGGVTNGRE